MKLLPIRPYTQDYIIRLLVKASNKNTTNVRVECPKTHMMTFRDAISEYHSLYGDKISISLKEIDIDSIYIKSHGEFVTGKPYIYWKEECDYCEKANMCENETHMRMLKSLLSQTEEKYMQINKCNLNASLKYNCDYFTLDEDKYLKDNMECGNNG